MARGRRLGRTLGFPTANVEADPLKIAPPGVFAVRVRIRGKGKASRSFRGLCNVGFRPTVEDPSGAPLRTVEAHLLGFSGNLYGRRLEIEFLKKLRSERKFSGLDALKSQILRDRSAALRYFRSRG